jgi:hypothetical protein
MKIALERHAYSPEMNRAHILRRGQIVASMPAPACQSIREARQRLFAPAKPGRLVAASYERAAPWEGLNRTYRALYPLGGEALRKIAADSRQLAAKHAGGELWSGDILPDAARRLVTRLQG